MAEAVSAMTADRTAAATRTPPLDLARLSELAEPCDHRTITTFSGARAGRLWACADCRTRFYPACPTCVDVGHRNVEHPSAAEPAEREAAR